MSLVCRLLHRRSYDPPEVIQTHADHDGGSAGYVGRFCNRCQTMRRPLSRFAPRPEIRV